MAYSEVVPIHKKLPCYFGNVPFNPQLLTSNGALPHDFLSNTLNAYHTGNLLKSSYTTGTFTPERLATIYPTPPLMLVKLQPYRNIRTALVGMSQHFTFWSSVFALASSIIKLPLKPDPKLALLGIGMDSWPGLTITRSWKQATPPDVFTTVHIVNEHALF